MTSPVLNVQHNLRMRMKRQAQRSRWIATVAPRERGTGCDCKPVDVGGRGHESGATRERKGVTIAASLQQVVWFERTLSRPPRSCQTLGQSAQQLIENARTESASDTPRQAIDRGIESRHVAAKQTAQHRRLFEHAVQGGAQHRTVLATEQLAVFGRVDDSDALLHLTGPTDADLVARGLQVAERRERVCGRAVPGLRRGARRACAARPARCRRRAQLRADRRGRVRQ
jgi:hypothetical protein